ncbi:MAG: M28 family peptidase [Spirochaetaceae bacterium]|nr:MAG: M28 family peptidase [Spirochaetaceae bacterium]
MHRSRSSILLSLLEWPICPPVRYTVGEAAPRCKWHSRRLSPRASARYNRRMQNCDPRLIDHHIAWLSETIGPRLAGSTEEAAAADYIAETMRAHGAEVTIERFPVRSRRVTEESCAFLHDGRWQEVPCSTVGGSVGTDGQTIEGDLVIVEPPMLRRESYDLYRGKAVMLLGTHIENPDHYRRLIAAGPAFLILVDVRYPAAEPRADGLFPAYVHAYGVVPTVAVPYQHAWRFANARSARVRIVGGPVDSQSQNVIAELLPTAAAPIDDDQPIVLVGGHHDTQADSPGADDNATGVAAVIELTRLLAPIPRRRPVRLISFGAEEQLSVGSASYVRTHRSEVERRGGYVCNFDSFGSRMGWFDLHVCADGATAGWLQELIEGHGVFSDYTIDTVPYQDAFPFHAAGLPGHWVYRANCTAGRFYHHQPDDDRSKLDLTLIAAMIDAHARVVSELAGAEAFPVSARLPVDLREQIERYWRDCFGGWDGFTDRG